jgi:hypothetical protein
MRTTLVVMLLLFGLVVGLPLWLAWLRATGRFAAVERVLGTYRQPSRWAWLGPVTGAGSYVLMGWRSSLKVTVCGGP